MKTMVLNAGLYALLIIGAWSVVAILWLAWCAAFSAVWFEGPKAITDPSFLSFACGVALFGVAFFCWLPAQNER